MKNINEQIITAFNYRFACKVFDPNRKISDIDFDTIIETARLSPSSFGFEPWNFIVIENRETLEKLRPITWGGQGQFPTASHVVVLLARKMIDTKAHSEYLKHVMQEIQKLPEDVQVGRGEKFQDFQENDFDLNDERKLFDWACKQTYIALSNMMSSAALLGIDSCPIEGFKRTEFEKILIQEGILDPEHFGVSVVAAFGYRDPASELRTKTRGASKDIIKWVK